VTSRNDPEWASASSPLELETDPNWKSSYSGLKIDPGNLGIRIEDVMIEGTPEELLDLGLRLARLAADEGGLYFHHATSPLPAIRKD
jgi:hypothetical protein